MGESYLFWSIKFDEFHVFSRPTLSYSAYHGQPPRAYKERRDPRASAYFESVTSDDGGLSSSGEVYDVCQYT